jgi:amino-acid N-acetyltransferase
MNNSNGRHNITIRKATLADAPAIGELVNRFSARGLMLPKSQVQVYESLREFVVAVDEAGAVLGCGALRLMWHDLAEVRSLAVDDSAQGLGLGRRMVAALIDEAREMGLARVFALTYQRVFFEKLGFAVCDRSIFPQKVWADCRACPKRHCCDEIAMLLVLDAERAERANEEARQQTVETPPFEHEPNWQNWIKVIA